MRKKDLENDSIKSLFYFYLSSAIIGMLIRSVHGLVDGIFVGNGVGEQGLAAVNMGMPLITVISAVAMLFSVGGATNVSINFGKGDKEKGQNIFVISLLTMLLFTGLIQIVYFRNSQIIISALGANEAILDMMISYCDTIVAFAPAFALNIGLTAFVRNDNNPKHVMYAQAIGAATNICLNYLFIYVMGLGLFGAALGTGFAQIVATLVLSLHFIKDSSKLKMNFSKFKYSIGESKSILIVGFPSFIAEIGWGIVWVTLNLIIMSIKGDVGVSAFGIIFYVCGMGYAILGGVSQAIQPIISYNFGLKNSDRVKQAFRLGSFNALIIGFVFSIICFVFAKPLVGLFGANSKELVDLAVGANRLMALTYVFIAYNSVVATFFQSIGDGKTSLIIQMLRGIVLTMILVLILPKFFGFTGVIMAFPLGEVISTFVCIIFMKKRQNVIDIIL